MDSTLYLSKARLIFWFLLYLTLSGSVAALVAHFVQYAPSTLDIFDESFLLVWRHGPWLGGLLLAIDYCVRVLPIAVAEVVLLTVLCRSKSLVKLAWMLGVLFPLILELIWHYPGGGWLTEGLKWLDPGANSGEELLPLDMISRNAVANLLPPLVAGFATTWVTLCQTNASIRDQPAAEDLREPHSTSRKRS